MHARDREMMMMADGGGDAGEITVLASQDVKEDGRTRARYSGDG
jgi:hypothetical protein